MKTISLIDAIAYIELVGEYPTHWYMESDCKGHVSLFGIDDDAKQLRLREERNARDGYRMIQVDMEKLEAKHIARYAASTFGR